jgi:hypothetical protein
LKQSFGLNFVQPFELSQFNLGLLYANGTGVPKDSAKAAALWQKAAEQGYPAAQTNLGYLYKKWRGGAEGFTQSSTALSKGGQSRLRTSE